MFSFVRFVGEKYAERNGKSFIYPNEPSHFEAQFRDIIKVSEVDKKGVVLMKAFLCEHKVLEHRVFYSIGPISNNKNFLTSEFLQILAITKEKVIDSASEIEIMETVRFLLFA